MIKRSIFEKDFDDVASLFPKLSYKFQEKSKIWLIEGELDICDKAGGYWGTFEIIIYVSNNYPYCIPLVREKSCTILREDDWHINNEGFCCIDIEHKLQILKNKGIKLKDFIRDKVYPYFANQIYKKKNTVYAAGEYRHGFDGIRQFYEEELNIKNNNLAINIIKTILNNHLPGRNDPCLCGDKKFKNCHLLSVEILKSISKGQLIEDLENFQKLTS